MSPRLSRAYAGGTPSDGSSAPPDTSPTPSPTRRRTRSMGLDVPPELQSSPAPSTPSTPSKRARVKAERSPYFVKAEDGDGDEEVPTPARKRAKMPADLEPWILAEQLRPAVPLHPIERKPTDFGLLQELMAPDPWKLIIAVCLLNQTAGRAVRPVLWQLLDRYPTPPDLAAADELELTALLYPIGLYRIRAKRLIAFSRLYVEQPPRDDVLHANKNDKLYAPTPVSHYPGVGTYALDSYQIFIAGGGADVLEPRSHSPDAPWRSVMPADKELIKYLAWRWAIDGQLWTPDKGVVGPLPVGHGVPQPGHLTSDEAYALAHAARRAATPSAPRATP